MNGSQIQKNSYLGRYLSFSALVQETQTWKQADLNMQFHRMKPDQQAKAMDGIANKFFNLHSGVADVIKKLMKNAAAKDRLLLWMRKAVSLNLDK